MVATDSLLTTFVGRPKELTSLADRLPDREYRFEVHAIPEPERDYLQEAIDRMNNRTPEQILADRAEIFANSPTPTPIPPGKTFEDMVVGRWPGDETDEQIRVALEELS